MVRDLLDRAMAAHSRDGVTGRLTGSDRTGEIGGEDVAQKSFPPIGRDAADAPMTAVTQA